MSLRTSYPITLRGTRARHFARYPRSSRCGLVALTATLFLAGILLSLSSLWAVGQARQKIAGEAALVAEAVARAGYGLHHWLHEERSDDCDRFVFSVEDNPLPGGCDLLDHGAWAGWARPPRGWEIIVDTAIPPNQAWDQALPHGILIVRPSACTTERDQILHSEVAQRLGVAINPDAYVFDFNNNRCDIVRAAGPALGNALNIPTQSYDLVVFAHAFSRIDPSLVLREPRAGFSPPVMETALTFICKDENDNDVPCDITGIETLAVVGDVDVNPDGGADTPSLTIRDKIDGSLVIEQGESGSDEPVLIIAGEGDATADLNITGNLAVRNDITLTTPEEEEDRVNIGAVFGAINTISGPGDGPGLTVKNRWFCPDCGGDDD